MTNGDVIKAILKTRTDQIRIYSNFVEIEIQSLSINFSCDLDWWYAEYKDSTTKNDLEVEKTDMVDKSNFSQEQYKADLQSAYDCGYAQAEKDLGVDCIDRAKAQTEIEMKASRYTIAKERGGMGQVEWSDQLIKVSDAVDIIRKLPSVTPQEPRWIPVSEGLPEKSGNYWCTFGTNLTGSDYYTTESDAKKLFDDPEEYAGWRSQNVIAWMPLPKSYKAESKEQIWQI